MSADISNARPGSAGYVKDSQLMSAPTGPILLVLNAVLVDVLFTLGRLLRRYLRRRLRKEARAQSDSDRVTLAVLGTCAKAPILGVLLIYENALILPIIARPHRPELS